MRCSRIERLFSDYLDGALPPHREAEVAGHLRDCAGCSAEFRQLQASLKALERTRATGPVEDLWSGLQARLAATGEAARLRCAEASEWLPAYLDAALAPEQQATLAAHLGTCRRCAGEATALRRSLALLENLPLTPPPADLWERVAARLETQPRWRWGRAAWPAIGFATAAAAALIIGAFNAPAGRPGLPHVALTKNSGAAPTLNREHSNVEGRTHEMVRAYSRPATSLRLTARAHRHHRYDRAGRYALAALPREHRRARRPARELMALGSLPTRKTSQSPVVEVKDTGELQKIALLLAPVGESLEKAPRFDDLAGARESDPDATQ